MRTGQTFVTIDDEVLFWFDARFLGGPGDVEAADGEVGVLDVEVVGVAHGAVLINGNADAACEGGLWLAVFSFLLTIYQRVLEIVTHCLSID